MRLSVPGNWNHEKSRKPEVLRSKLMTCHCAMICHPLSDKQESADNMRILYKGAANLTTQQPHIMHHEYVASLSDIEWTKINQT